MVQVLALLLSRIGRPPSATLLRVGVIGIVLALSREGFAETSPVFTAEPQQQGVPLRVFNDPNGQAAASSTPQVTTAQPTVVPGSKGPVQEIELATPNKAQLSARKGSYTVKVSGADWTDTHIELAPTDQVEFTAKGSVTLADGRKVTPDGSARGWKDLLRQFPNNAAQAGALIGRIGNDPAVTPFMIGSSKTLSPPTSGELYLAINASSDLNPDGSFEVTVKLSKQTEQAAAGPAPDLTRILSPSLFNDIPRRVQDQAGHPGDMVNFALIGTEDQIQKAFGNAGWVKVDKTTEDAFVHGLLATLGHEAYTEMPMSTLFLFGRPQDLSYARADPIKVAATRHHLRIWKTTETVAGRPLWVGSATHDMGFEKDQRNGGVTHHIDPDIDKERDFIEQSFAAAGDLTAAAYVTPSNPVQTARTATGGGFHSDGRIVVLDLR